MNVRIIKKTCKFKEILCHNMEDTGEIERSELHDRENRSGNSYGLNTNDLYEIYEE